MNKIIYGQKETKTANIKWIVSVCIVYAIIENNTRQRVEDSHYNYIV